MLCILIIYSVLISTSLGVFHYLKVMGSSLRSPAEGEGHVGFPPPPDKDKKLRVSVTEESCVEANLKSTVILSGRTEINEDLEGKQDIHG